MVGRAQLSADKQKLVERLLRGQVEGRQARRLDALGFASAPLLTHDAAGRFEPFPLTDMQQAYWVGRQGTLELGNVAIHSYLEIEIEALDVARLEAAWNAVIHRHDMLRAVILPSGRQQVLAEVDRYHVSVETFGSTADHDGARKRLRERMSHQVFTPERWPLFEVLVTRGPDGVSVAHVSADGVLLDAWSLSTIIRECLELYENPDRRLPRLDITFRDYVLAQRKLREGPAYAASLDWWRRRLDALPGPPDLPLLQHPRMLRRPTFVRRSGTLDPEKWQQFRQRAGSEGVTPACLLLAIWAEVLAEWSASRRFTVNIPRFERLPLHPQVDDLVGEFASFTLLACDLSRPATTVERGRQLQRQMWELLEHGQVSGLDVVRQLMRVRGRGGAMFPVVFTANPTLGAHKPPEMPGSVRCRVVNAITQTPQVWLDFQVGEQHERLAFNWDAVDELFPPGALDQMNASFCDLLHGVSDEFRSRPLVH